MMAMTTPVVAVAVVLSLVQALLPPSLLLISPILSFLNPVDGWQYKHPELFEPTPHY